MRHGTFGTGVVIGYEGSGAHTQVHVNFEDVGMKILILGFANLTPA